MVKRARPRRPTQRFTARTVADLKILCPRVTHADRRPTLAVTIARPMLDRLGWRNGDTLLLQITTTGKLLVQRFAKGLESQNAHQDAPEEAAG